MSKGTGAAILEAEIDGYRVKWKNDGVNYSEIWKKFKDGQLPTTRFFTNSCFRQVYKAEIDGRHYILKIDRETDPRFEKRLWDRLGGTAYSRLIKFTNRAVSRGCHVVQDVYLVAEKMNGPSCQEAYLVAEFVEGQSFVAEEYVEGKTISDLERDFRPWLPAMGEALADLHDWGLASNDVQPGNFILTTQGLRVIDLSLDSPIFICQANDMLKMRGWYHTPAPIRGFWRKFFYGLIYLKSALQLFVRRQRGREREK